MATSQATEGRSYFAGSDPAGARWPGRGDGVFIIFQNKAAGADSQGQGCVALIPG